MRVEREKKEKNKENGKKNGLKAYQFLISTVVPNIATKSSSIS